ncbi:MAG: hypothetical protein JRE65_15355 [Deltaproteobacteria bacterium]|jgi:hypothetical protein|nr:hypothetical protein [Deltaproteobacteria bacterium]
MMKNASVWWKATLVMVLWLMPSTILYATSMQKIESALETARNDLRISMATEERISFELDKLKQSEHIPPDIIIDYHAYLIRVQAMVAENRQKVDKMEALSARYNARKATHEALHKDATSAMLDPSIPEEQVVDEVTVLDRKLDSSLAEFDEMLLKELDLIQAKSSEKLQDLAQEAEAAAQRLRDKGIEIDTDSNTETDESHPDSSKEAREAEKEKSTPEAGKQSDTKESTDDTALTTQGKSREGMEGSQRHPQHRYDPKDDDIVARQLREAAEKESDPELKEKLWKEYEHYKKNTSK